VESRPPQITFNSRNAPKEIALSATVISIVEHKISLHLQDSVDAICEYQEGIGSDELIPRRNDSEAYQYIDNFQIRGITQEMVAEYDAQLKKIDPGASLVLNENMPKNCGKDWVQLKVSRMSTYTEIGLKPIILVSFAQRSAPRKSMKYAIPYFCHIYKRNAAQLYDWWSQKVAVAPNLVCCPENTKAVLLTFQRVTNYLLMHCLPNPNQTMCFSCLMVLTSTLFCPHLLLQHGQRFSCPRQAFGPPHMYPDQLMVPGRVAGAATVEQLRRALINAGADPNTLGFVRHRVTQIVTVDVHDPMLVVRLGCTGIILETGKHIPLTFSYFAKSDIAMGKRKGPSALDSFLQNFPFLAPKFQEVRDSLSKPQFYIVSSKKSFRGTWHLLEYDCKKLSLWERPPVSICASLSFHVSLCVSLCSPRASCPQHAHNINY
jgi:hypothetical protein